MIDSSFTLEILINLFFSQALKDFEENVSGGCTTLVSCEYNAWHLIKVGNTHSTAIHLLFKESINLLLFQAILDFFGIFCASFLVGSLMGCITSLLTKFTHIRQHPLLESTLFVLMSYSTFLLAEVFGLTGIVAVRDVS